VEFDEVISEMSEQTIKEAVAVVRKESSYQMTSVTSQLKQ
jgi:hypothetical protein